MAVTTKVYGHLGDHLQAGDLDWAGDAMKLALVTSAYVVSQGGDEFWSDVVAHEIASGGGYTTGGFALAGCSVSYDATTRETRFDADDLSPGGLTPASPYRYGVIYDTTPGSAGTDFLVAYLNFGVDQDPAGLPFAVQWPATGVWYEQAV